MGKNDLFIGALETVGLEQRLELRPGELFKTLGRQSPRGRRISRGGMGRRRGKHFEVPKEDKSLFLCEDT